MRRAARVILGLGLVLVAGFGVLLWRGAEPGGIDDAWALVAGKPDLGPVDFATLERRSSPNDALACPPGLCAKAKPDIESPVFPVAGERLRAIVAEVAKGEPGTEIVFEDRWEEHDRYIVRSRLMRFPDTVDAHVIGAGEGRSTLALYSRSQIGYSDLGVNRARIERWLRRVGEIAAKG